jgi:hypothetical protein
MDATLTTRVALNERVRVDDAELVRVLGHPDLVARHDGDLSEERAFWLPTFGTAAHMIVRALARDAHLDGVARAVAPERAARETW